MISLKEEERGRQILTSKEESLILIQDKTKILLLCIFLYDYVFLFENVIL